MRKTELSEIQLRDLNIFNLLLEFHGWEDYQNTEKRMDQDTDMNPEGSRTLCNGVAVLEVKLHIPVNMISLRISDIYARERVQFHFLYDTQPEYLLEWLTSCGTDLSLETYPELLKDAVGKCEMILLEISDTEIYEVRPPAKSEYVDGESHA